MKAIWEEKAAVKAIKRLSIFLVFVMVIGLLYSETALAARYRYINKRGSVVIPFIYDGESSDYDEKGIYFNKGKVKMFKNGVEGYLNKKGVFTPIR